MSSQLNVDTIVDKAGSSGPSLPNTTTIKIGNTSTYVSDGGNVTQNTVQGLAKSWSITSGTDATSDDSFNYSSNTDNGTGDYTHTTTNNYSASSYSVPATCGQDSSTFTINKNRTTANVRCMNIRHDNASIDVDQVHVVHGDLA